MTGDSIRRAFSRGLGISLLLLAAACDDTTGSVPSEAAGSYTLVRVNDQSLPVAITSTPELRVEVTGGAMAVRANGEYRETRQSRVTDSEGTRTGASFTEGTLRVSGSSLEVREKQGGTYDGSYTGTTLSYVIPAGATSVSLTYEKD